VSVLSILDSTPNRVRSLVRLVAYLGPAERMLLREHMMPDRGDSAAAQFNNLMRETIRLGLLADKDGQISLADGITPRDVEKDDRFLAQVDRTLVHPPGPADENKSFARALAWLLGQSSGTALPWRSDQHLVMKDQLEGEDVHDLTNEDRFAMLCYWGRFLGFVTRLHLNDTPTAVPDPTEAIDRRLRGVFAEGSPLPVGRFLGLLARECTVLEGGAVRSEIEQRLRTKRSPNQLSAATSLALWRLERRQRIRLGFSSDADAWQMITSTVATGAGAARRISHVEYLG
jgi:hypothetical protein